MNVKIKSLNTILYDEREGGRGLTESLKFIFLLAFYYFILFNKNKFYCYFYIRKKENLDS